MEYKQLSKLFHIRSDPDRYRWIDEQAEYRRSMPSSFDVGIDTPNGRLFVAMPRDLTVLYERVLRTERKVSSMMRSIPGIARSALTRSLVLDEVASTNAIEEIHSTKKQVEDALDAAMDEGPGSKRFRELARLYLELSRSEHAIPTSPEDVRAIYDMATKGEIPKGKLPDGRLFRAQGVQITAGDVKVIHNGLEPEEKIVEAIEAMLALTGRGDIPEVIAAIASHYVFEYAHPFYDGNGRTGRYLLSLFLSDALSAPTVLSLSRSIAENRDLYYRAFASVEDPMNRGELTFFVADILELVRRAQLRIIADIEESGRNLDAAAKRMDPMGDAHDLSDREASAVFALAQYELFGMYGFAYLDDLAEFMGLKSQMTRKYIASLERKGLVETRSKRPLKFSLTDMAKAELGIE